MSTDESMSVRFTAKELFAQVNQKLDMVLDKLETKADRHLLDELIVRVDHLETSIRDESISRAALSTDETARLNKRDKIVIAFVAVVNSVVGFIALLPTIHN